MGGKKEVPPRRGEREIVPTPENPLQWSNGRQYPQPKFNAPELPALEALRTLNERSRRNHQTVSGIAQDLVVNPKILAMSPKGSLSFTADELASATGTPLLTEEEIMQKMQEEKTPTLGVFERGFNALAASQAQFDADQPAFQARQQALLDRRQEIQERQTARQSFLTSGGTKQKNLPRILLAAAGAGLFASLMLTAQMTKSHTVPTQAPIASVGATAKLLQRCALDLPAIQLTSVSKTLDEWSPVWLATSNNLKAQDQNDLCTHLLGASFQGPAQGDPGDQAAFQAGLEETKQLMLTQIAGQVLESDAAAEEVAPLMGLAPSDVQHYFKSVKQGSPAQGSGPTPEAGPNFSV